MAVLISVAKSELIPCMPTLASMVVNAAKMADKKAQNIHDDEGIIIGVLLSKNVYSKRLSH